jgi:protein gp37
LADRSAIEWTDATWNPITGCTKVSPGCDNCYAHTLAHGRLSDVYLRRLPVVDNNVNISDPFAVRVWPERLDQPRKWREPRMVFVNSMSDPWHVDVPADFLRRMFEVMLDVDRHVYQVLTKRPARAAKWVRANMDLFPSGEVPPHIWIGTSVENQDVAYRVGHLQNVPAAVRFLSCEPLLGEIDLRRWSEEGLECSECPWAGSETETARADFDDEDDGFACPRCGSPCAHTPLDELLGAAGGVHWIIAGGESGLGYRPLNLDHARSLRDQATAAGVPFFFKQVGGRTPKAGGRELDGRTWDEMPEVRR